jgi:hypothetical protein
MGQVGTNAMFVMDPKDMPNIPADRMVTYANIVVDFRPQKEDPHRIRITDGGNLINYPGKLTTQTADITMSKLHWNSMLSTQKAKYMCLNLKIFYLSAPLNQYKFMRIPLELFPPVDRRTIRPVDKSPQRAHLLGNAMGSVGSPTGWNLGKQITAQVPCSPWVL